MKDITWEANYVGQVVACEHHGDRNTVVACPVCIGYARMVLVRYERMIAALKAYAEETDYCIICDEHPSHGHAKSCIFEGGDIG